MSDVISVKQAADRLGVATSTVVRWWQRGSLSGYKLNPHARNSPLMIRVGSVEQLLAARRRGADEK